MQFIMVTSQHLWNSSMHFVMILYNSVTRL